MDSKEKAITGTLELVAAGAAPFAPWGTVASVVIMAGIQIYKAFDAVSEAEKEMNDKIDNAVAKLSFLKANSDTIERAKRRPKMPLDIYSGPPMYWIVPSSDYNFEGKQYYQLPNGEIQWPAGATGGFTPMPDTNKKNVNIDDVYAPFPPQSHNTPSICVFFWAVPIFFARLQQIIGEGVYKPGYDPKSLTEDGKQTKEAYLASIIKTILIDGRMDAAGNWFGKIGTVVPPVALDDDDYAGRYYGRSAWVHSLAMQNIKFANGQRISSSGISLSKDEDYYRSENAKAAIADSDWYAKNRPAFAIAKGSPYFVPSSYSKQETGTPVINSGHIFDFENFISRFQEKSGTFVSDLRSKFMKGARTDDSLYYVVDVPAPQQFENIDTQLSFRLGQPNVGSSLISIDSFYSMIISQSGGFANKGISSWAKTETVFTKNAKVSLDWRYADGCPINWTNEFIGSRVHGHFSLAPFKLFMYAAAENVDDGRPPRPAIGPSVLDSQHSTYGFFDFDPEVFKSVRVPGLWDGGENINDYNWLRNLAFMPGFNADSNTTDYKYNAIASSGITPRWSWWGGIAGNYAGDLSEARKCELMIISTFSVVNVTRGYNEIIKLRPPLPGEPTVKLSRDFWGEGAAWAKNLNKDEVDFALKYSNVAVFKFQRLPLNGVGVPDKPLTAAYFKTNLEENKPIVEIEGKSNPSPFYCGRRADPRTKLAWRTIRANELGLKEDKLKGSGWENCHEWSWPYSDDALAEIGRISKNLYLKHGEGIGRAGLSISSIATGPTIWGDSALFLSRYNSMKSGTSTDPKSKQGFQKFIAISMWKVIMEMQSGAYSRYAWIKENFNSTFAQDVQDIFNIYCNNDKARAAFASKAKEAADNKNPPKVWNEKTKSYIIMNSDQAADLCMSVVNAWFNGTFPKPTKEYEERFGKSMWDAAILEKAADAHIRLKNWAIDQGKPKGERKNVAFPDDSFTINFSGLNKANRIAIESLNSVIDEKAKVTNPIQIGINQTIDSVKTISTSLEPDRKKPRSPIFNTQVMLTAGAVLATTALLAKVKSKR